MYELKEFAREVLTRRYSGEEERDGFGLKMKLCKKVIANLGSFGTTSPVADVVGVMEEVRKSGSLLGAPDSGFFLLIKLLQEIAGPDDADLISKMLEWEEFFEGDDRSSRCVVLNIMWRIGSERHIPALEKFGERLADIVYMGDEDDFWGERLHLSRLESLYSWDAYEVRKAIDACRNRVA